MAITDEQGMALRERADLLAKGAEEAQVRLHSILHGDQPAKVEKAESKASNTIMHVAETIDDAHRSIASVHTMLDELAARLG